MADTEVLAVYDDFSKGHYDAGALGLDMPPGTFRGVNVMPHTSGMLMLRRGVSDLTTSNSPLVLITGGGRGGNNDLYFTSDSEGIFQWDSNTVSSTTGLWGASDQLGMLFADNKMYVGTSGSTGFHTFDGTTTASPNSNVRGTCLAVFKDRLYIGGDLTGTGYRVWYSESADYDNFGADNFFDVPPAFGRVQCLEVLDDTLVIGMQNAVSGIPRWWVLTDCPDTGGELQEIGNGPYPYDFRSVAKIQEGVVVASADGVYIYKGGRQFDRVDNIFPLHPIPSQSSGGGQIAVSEDGYSCVVCDPNTAYIYHYNGHTGVWTRHRESVPRLNINSGLGKMVSSNGPTTYAFFRDDAIVGSGPYVLAQQYDFQDNEIPSGQYEDVIDLVDRGDVTGHAYFPPAVAPPGQQFVVRGVAVEGYSHGVTPTLSAELTMYETTGQGGAASTIGTDTMVPYDSATVWTVYNTLSTAGIKGRRFQLRLTFSQMAVRRVLVFGTLEADRETR